MCASSTPRSTLSAWRRPNPNREVVFFGIGFETTAPANAMAVFQAKQLGLTNFSMLVSHVLVPPAIAALMESPASRVQAFLAAGHVCSVMGAWQYEPLVARYGVPIVITGFEPLDVLLGIKMAVQQLEQGRAELENAYTRAVQTEGNPAAQRMLLEVFEPTDRAWRGIGEIPQSGWRLREPYHAFDAERKFGVGHIDTHESPLCRSGDVLQGKIKPNQCAAFWQGLHPSDPTGRHHGLQRGCVCGVLSVWPIYHAGRGRGLTRYNHDNSH